MENAIVNVIPAALAVIATNGTVRFVNPEFTRLVGFNVDQAITEIPMYKQLSPPWSLVLEQLLKDSKSGASRNVMRINEKWYRLTGRPLSDSQTDLQMVIIEDYSSQSGQLSHLSRDTIDDILFHIRSPLTAMRCSLSLLSSTNVFRSPKEQTQSVLRILQDETDRVNILLNNLNALLLIDSNTLKLRAEPRALPVGSLIHYTIGALTRFAQLRNVNIRLTLGEDLPDIHADEDYLVKAMRNILINAVMYSPVGSDITVIVREELESIRISVIDYGDGIHTDELESIFQRFFRGRNAKDKEIPGFGLGLYVAKNLIESTGGSLEVRSKHMHGSQFDIELPLDESLWLS